MDIFGKYYDLEKVGGQDQGNVRFMPWRRMVTTESCCMGAVGTIRPEIYGNLIMIQNLGGNPDTRPRN